MDRNELETVIDVLSNKRYNNYNLEVLNKIKEDLSEITSKEEADHLKSRTLSMEECKDFYEFENDVQEILHEELMTKTPHGEYGGDIEDIFYWNDKEWLCTYSPDWNRYDKQYYFIDNYGDNLKIEELKYEKEESLNERNKI